MALRIPATLTIGATCLTLAWLVFLLIAKPPPVEAQSSDFLSPDPSTVDFEADGDIWHKFTVNSNRQVKVVINPTGSALRLEITFAHSRTNVCPGEWNDTKTRNDGQYFFLSACTAGTATVELRDASDDSHIRTYTFNVRAASTPPPTATPSPTPTPRPTLPPVQLNIGPRVELGNQLREERVQRDIDELRETMPELASKIENLPWVKDGIARGELGAVVGLVFMADGGHTARLIEEPWVIEGTNFPALESLSALKNNTPESFSRVMSHPTISDGITDREAKIVATLFTAANPVGYRLEDHDLLDKLLDPEQVTLEERTITLPLAGETEISIVRTRPRADHTMDFLEHSVRSIEEFMGLPFPRQQIIYLFAEAPGGGIHHGTHVSIRADEQVTSAESMFDIVAHEASHYYWTGVTPSWIKEGAATFLEAIAKGSPQDPLDWSPCAVVRSIAELEELERDPSAPRESRLCHYSLGERLFHDLYRNMDDTTFRLAFRRLYLHTVYEIADECRNANGWANICDVKEAFTVFAPEETATIIEKVIARWYDGTQPYDLSRIEDIPVKAEIAAINGQIEGAYLSLSRGGSPISTITVVGLDLSNVLYFNLNYSYGNPDGLESLPIEIALYFEDGFEFHRTVAELPAPTDGTRRTHHVWIPYANAPGRYWVQAYWREQKIAEATFEIIRELDPPSIRGVVTVQDGQPPEKIALMAKRGEERFWTEAGSDGTFDVAVPSGSFILEVLVLIGNNYRFVGYYDGSGGVTVDRSGAFEVVVDDANVEGIEIKLTNEDLNRIS